MELVAIILIVFLILLIRSGSKGYKEKKKTKSYRDYDVSKRSSPHPNDTVLGNAEPTKTDYLQEIQRELDKLSKLPKDSDHEVGKYLLVDTETTGLPYKRNAPPEDFTNWPYIVEIAWYLIDEDGLLIDGCHYIVKQNVDIPVAATRIHHITTQKMLSEGTLPAEVYNEFADSASRTEYIIAHNLDFDFPIIECELLRNGFGRILASKKKFCTMRAGREFCTVYDRAGHVKNPKLVELFGELYFDNPYLKLEGTHNALADTNLLYRCFMRMKDINPDLLCNSECMDEESVTCNLPKFNSVVVKNEDLHDDQNCCLMVSDDKLFAYFGANGFCQSQVLVTGVAKEEKDNCWMMIEKLNGKVVKSVTKNLSIVVLGPVPGWKKVENIRMKTQAGDKILGITDVQLQILYEQLK